MSSITSQSSQSSMASSGSTKARYTITEILQNKCPSPYTLKEFEAYLKKQHSEEMLEFLLTLKKFREKIFGMGTPFPPVAAVSPPMSPTGATVKSGSNTSISTAGSNGGTTSSRLSALPETAAGAGGGSYKLDALNMMETYFVNGADKELAVSQPTRKRLCADIGEGNTHPDVFQKAVDEVIDILKGSWLVKFLDAGAKK